MNVLKKFENNYESAITELLVLTNERVSGGYKERGMIVPSLKFIAYVNLQTGEFSQERGVLQWMIPDDNSRTGWGFDFEQFQIYRIRARKHKQTKGSYLLLEILEENVSDPQLNPIKEHVSTPVTIEDSALGTFLLEREYSWFEGTADWLGTECHVYLITDEEDGETAEKAYAHFQTLYQDRDAWDDKFRQFSADSLLELANDWYDPDNYDENLDDELDNNDEDLDDEMPIKRDEFIRRMSIESIEIDDEGDMTVYYNADEMFTDHAIVIYAEIRGKISSADIIG
ncbi:MAG: DUF2262 domain-containing protein [Lachnospiraceae bacterium]|nr:DUF2262 domain-containing protein [Lachnospiraceae bacterium]